MPPPTSVARLIADRARRVAQPRQIEQAAADEQVRGRAERGDRARVRQALQLLIREMQTVTEDRARPEQPAAVVHVGVAPGAREQPADRGDLLVVLGQMRLQVGVRMLAQQRARGLQLSLARGHRKTWRDRVQLPAASVPGLEQRFGFSIAALGGIGERGRSAPVHHHLAGDHARVAPLRLGEERVDRLGVDRAIDHGRGGAAAQQLVEEKASYLSSMRRAVELLLRDERVPVQPFQELRAVRRDHPGLRIVDVGVDQARQDQAIGVLINDCAGRQPGKQRRRVAGLDDPAALDHEQTVLVISMARRRADLRGIVQELQERAAQRARACRRHLIVRAHRLGTVHRASTRAPAPSAAPDRLLPRRCAAPNRTRRPESAKDRGKGSPRTH